MKDSLQKIINTVSLILKLNENEEKLILKLKDILKEFDTIYKQDRVLLSLEQYNKPVEKQLGIRQEPRIVEGIPKLITLRLSYQYISIKKTLRILLGNSDIRKHLNTNVHNCTSDIIPILYSKPFWNKNNTLRLLLYYDDIEVKNPLSYAAGVYKLGIFKFVILNLGHKHNANINNIFKVALGFSDDIKGNMDSILSTISDEISSLESEGINVVNQTYYASLAQTAGDNLGSRQIHGLKTGFL